MQSKRSTTATPNTTCEVCASPFYVQPSIKRQGYGRFCSTDCSAAHHRARAEAECQMCGAVFETKRHRSLDPSRGKFCGRACYWAHKRTVSTPLADRFWPKVNKDAPTPEHMPHLGRCWIWTSSCDPKGYGSIGEGGREGRDLRAHRVAWMLTYGPIEDGLWVLHHCDNPSCCNPDHLWLGTAADNTADMMRKGRHFTQRTLP